MSTASLCAGFVQDVPISQVASPCVWLIGVGIGTALPHPLHFVQMPELLHFRSQVLLNLTGCCFRPPTSEYSVPNLV
jgi:hypothetical protein